jgi:CubicO group peptidase (beta-lactamase class C family)
MQFRDYSLLIFLWAVTACAAPPPTSAENECVSPRAVEGDWPVASPVEAGFDAASLCALLDTIARDDENIHGLLVERRGRLVAERYSKGTDRPIHVLYGFWNPFGSDVDFGPDTLHDVRSISKSVIGLLVGIALDQGKLTTLTKPVIDFYPELDIERSPEREAITLYHLLTMSSGLQWDEGALPNDETRLYWKSNQPAFVLGRPMDHAPGKHFNYNSGGSTLLSDILSRTYGNPWVSLAQTELFEPLGITRWQWATDLRDRPMAFTGLRLRPRDMLKLGRLMLDRGQWHGRQIVPESWVADSLRPHLDTGFHTPSEAKDALGYGYQWWTGVTPWQGRKLNWAAAFGNGGQRIFVVPELDMTVVVTAGGYGSVQTTHAVNQLFHRIVATAAIAENTAVD